MSTNLAPQLNLLPLDIEPLQGLEDLGFSTNDPNFLPELMRLFTASSAAWIADLKAALAADDSKATAHHAHRLKGSGASLGAKHFVSACLDLELAGRQGDLSRAQIQLQAIESELERALEALAWYLNQSPKRAADSTTASVNLSAARHKKGA